MRSRVKGGTAGDSTGKGVRDAAEGKEEAVMGACEVMLMSSLTLVVYDPFA